VERVPQRPEQHAAMDAEAVEPGGEIRVRHVHHQAPVCGLAVEALDARGALFDWREEPEPGEDDLAGGLDEECGCGAAGSAADDGDSHGGEDRQAHVNGGW